MLRKFLAALACAVFLLPTGSAEAHLGEVKAWASQSSYWTVVNGSRITDDGDWAFKCVAGTGNVCVKTSDTSPLVNFMYEHEASGIVSLCYRARALDADPVTIRIWALHAITGQPTINWYDDVTGTGYHTVCLPEFVIPDGTVGRLYVKATVGEFRLRYLSMVH